MNDLDSGLEGVSAIAVALYLTAVVYNGQGMPLVGELRKEARYIEFLSAAYLLSQIATIKKLQPVGGMLVFGALLAVVIGIAGKINISALKDFGSGKTDMIGLAKQLFT